MYIKMPNLLRLLSIPILLAFSSFTFTSSQSTCNTNVTDLSNPGAYITTTLTSRKCQYQCMNRGISTTIYSGIIQATSNSNAAEFLCFCSVTTGTIINETYCPNTCTADNSSCGGITEAAGQYFSVTQLPCSPTATYSVATATANSIITGTARYRCTRTNTIAAGTTVVYDKRYPSETSNLPATLSTSWTTNSLSYAYRTPGYTAVAASTITSDGDTSKTTTVVQIRQNIGIISDIPICYVLFNTSYLLPLYVTLTSAASINFTIMNYYTASSSILSSYQYILGSSFGNQTDQVVQFNQTGMIWLMPQMTITRNSTIIDIRFQRNGTYNAAGTNLFYLQIYRPQCQNGYKYCYFQNLCIQAQSNCTPPASNARNKTCPSATMTYSMNYRSCVNKTSRLPVASHPPNTLEFTSYYLAFDLPININSGQLLSSDANDYFINILQKNLTLRPGDVPAIYQADASSYVVAVGAGSSVVASPNSITNWGIRSGSSLQSYPTIVVANSNLPVQTLQPLISFTLSGTVNVTMPFIYRNHSCTDSPVGCFNDDAYDVVVTVSNAISTSVVRNVMRVYMPILDIQINQSNLTTSFIVSYFQAARHTGSFPNYVINFGDGQGNVTNLQYLGSIVTVPHFYILAGTYTTTMYAYNLLTSGMTSQTVLVQDAIVGLQIYALVYPAGTFENNLDFIFAVSQGSNSTTTIDFADGTPLITLQYDPNQHPVAMPCINHFVSTVGATQRYGSTLTFPTTDSEECARQCLLSTTDTFFCQMFTLDVSGVNNPCVLFSYEVSMRPNYAIAWSPSTVVLWSLQNSTCSNDLLNSIAYTVNASSGTTENGVGLAQPGWTNATGNASIMFGFSTFVQIYVIRVGSVNGSGPVQLNVSMSNDTFNWTPYSTLLTVPSLQDGTLSSSIKLNTPINTRFLQIQVVQSSGSPVGRFGFSGCIMRAYQYKLNHTYYSNMTEVKNITVQSSNLVSSQTFIYPYYIDVPISNTTLTLMSPGSTIYTNMSLPFRVSGIWGSYLEIIIYLHDNTILLNQTFNVYQPYFDFNLTFVKNNQWYLSVNVSNYVSQGQFQMKDPVTVIALVSTECAAPYVDLVIPNACVYPGTCTSFVGVQSMTVTRSSIIQIRSNSTNFCNGAAMFQWGVESCTTPNNCVDYTPNITSIYTQYYPTVPVPIYYAGGLSTLIFNPRTFTVGFYRFQLTVTIVGVINNITFTQDTTLVGSSNPAYFYVKSSPLSACVNDNTFCVSSVLDPTLNVTLDASCSSDPDVWDPADYHLQYSWSCYLPCESAPKYNSKLEFIPWSNETIYSTTCTGESINLQGLQYSKVGCFLPFGLHISGPLIPRTMADYDLTNPANALTGTGNSNASLYGTVNYNLRDDVQNISWVYVTSADNKTINVHTTAIFYRYSTVFVLNVLKNDSDGKIRRAQSLAFVKVDGVPPPAIKMDCNSNCYPSATASPTTVQYIVDPFAPFKLSYVVTNFGPYEYFRTWSVVQTSGSMDEGIELGELSDIISDIPHYALNYDWTSHSSTGRYLSGVSFDSNYPIFEPALARKMLGVLITVSRFYLDTNYSSTAYKFFTVNQSPTMNMECNVQPNLGLEMTSDHTIQCTGGTTLNLPLMYSIGYSLYAENSTDISQTIDLAKQCTWLALSQRTCVFPGTVKFPVGNATLNYTLYLCIGGTDAVGTVNYAFLPIFQIFPANIDGATMAAKASTLSATLRANFNSYAPLAIGICKTIMPPTYDTIEQTCEPNCDYTTASINSTSPTMSADYSTSTAAPNNTISIEDKRIIVGYILQSLLETPNCTDISCLLQLAKIIECGTSDVDNMDATSIRVAMNATQMFAINLQALVSGACSSLNLNNVQSIAQSVILSQTAVIARARAIVLNSTNCTDCPLTDDDMRLLAASFELVTKTNNQALLCSTVPDEKASTLGNVSVRTVTAKSLSKLVLQPNPDTCNKFVINNAQNLFTLNGSEAPANVQYCNKQARDNQFLYVEGAAEYNQTQEMVFLVNGQEFNITNATGNSTFEIWMDTGLNPNDFPQLNANLTPYTLTYGKNMLTHKVAVKGYTNLYVNVQHYLNWTAVPVNVTVNGTTQIDYIQVLQNNGSYNASNVLFIVYVQKSEKPTDTDYIANCTLPNFNLTDLNCGYQDLNISATNESDITSMYETLKNITELKYYETLIQSDRSTRCSRYSDTLLNPWTCMFLADAINNTNDSTYYIGIRAIQWNWTLPFDNDTYNPNKTSPDAPTAYKEVDPSATTTVKPDPWIYLELNYTFFAYYAGCFFFNPTTETFDIEGCTIGKCSSPYATQCFCNHLTSFSNLFRLPPIGFDITSLNINALNNSPGVMLFLISIFCAYCIVWIWARYADVTAEETLGVTFLPSNDPVDPFGYEITVWTGQTPGSGTTSNVSILLAGDSGETEGRWLCKSEEDQKAFQRGSVDMFLLTTLNWLGPLSHIKIWHDNSGTNPSWYLMRILVRDLYTQTKYYFIVNNWLSITSEDGAISRFVPVAGKKELRDVKNVFLTRASNNLLDGHMWLSVATRPTRSRFTRVQRLTCCLVICLTAVLFNLLGFIVKFKSSQEALTSGSDPDPPIIVLGPLSITAFQLTISVISSLGSIPINMLIAMLFQQRRVRGIENQTNPYERYAAATSNETDEEEQQAIARQKEAEAEAEAEANEDSTACERCIDACSDAVAACVAKILPFPWWSHYVAYTLAAITSGTAFFCASVLAYSNLPEEWQQNAWLSTIILSLVQSIFIVQPLQIFLIVLAFSLIIRLPQEDTDEMSKEVAVRRPLVDIPDKNDNSVKQKDAVPAPPINSGFAKVLHDQRKEEEHLQSKITGLAFFMFFLILLFLALYTFISPWRFYQANNVANNQKLQFPYEEATTIYSINDVWQFLQYNVLPYLYNLNMTALNSTISLNGIYLYQMPLTYTADGASYLLGARLRLLRIAKSQCTVPDFFSSLIPLCYGDSDFITYDKTNYDYSWVEFPSNYSSNYTETTPFTYVQKANLLTPIIQAFAPQISDTGYVADLGDDLATALAVTANLTMYNWIDQRARKLFIEFVAFNPSTNLFVVSSSVINFQPTGIKYLQNIYPLWLNRYEGVGGSVCLITEVLAAFGLIIFMIKTFVAACCKSKKGNEGEWITFDLVVSFLAILTFAMYALQIIASLMAEATITEAPGSFINLQTICIMEGGTCFLFAAVVVLMNIRLIKYLLFIRRMRILIEAMQKAATMCLCVLFYVVVLTLAVTAGCYLIYFNYTLQFSTFVEALSSLLSTFLRTFKFADLNSDQHTLGSAMFVIYAWLVAFILARCYVSVLTWSLHVTRMKHEMLKEFGNGPLTYIAWKCKAFFGCAPPEDDITFEYLTGALDYEELCKNFQEKCNDFEYKVNNNVGSKGLPSKKDGDSKNQSCYHIKEPIITD